MRDDSLLQAKPGAKILVLPASDLARADHSALVAALRAGDARAPRVIWQRFTGMVHRVLRRFLGQTGELEDLVQEVFLHLFRRISTLREPKALPAFIISITNLTARHELRQRWVRRWISLGDSNDASQDQRASPSHPDPEARQALARFYRILDRLGSEDRMAFVLRFMEGMELSEVADVLDLSVASAKRRISHARARIEHHVGRDPALAEYLLDECKELP